MALLAQARSAANYIALFFNTNLCFIEALQGNTSAKLIG